MKHLFALATLLTFTIHIASSQSKYILVEVSDTIQVVPDEFHYTIFVQEGKNRQHAVPQEASNFVPFDMKILDDIIAKYPKIEKHKPNRPNMLKALYGKNMETVELKSSSFNEFVTLESDLKEHRQLKGYISNVDLHYNPDHELLLKKKLLLKASAKGEQTSKLLGKILGEIIATEESEMNNSSTLNAEQGWTGYPPISGWHTQTGEGGLVNFEKSTLSLTMKVKYQIQ